MESALTTEQHLAQAGANRTMGKFFDDYRRLDNLVDLAELLQQKES